MKRVVFVILLVAVVFWIVARKRHEHARMRFTHPAQAHGSGLYPGYGHEARRSGVDTHEQLTKALTKARVALADARQEVSAAVGEARQEVRTAMAKARQALASASNDLNAIHAEKDAGLCTGPCCEDVEGIPVPVVAGTRVTHAVPQPPAPPHAPVGVQGPKPLREVAPPATTTSAPGQTRSVAGQISATEERAKNDASIALERDVRGWLDPEVPHSWAPPAGLLQAMVQKTDIKTVPKEYGPMYVAELTYDSTPSRRNSLIETYNRQLVRHRLTVLGGTLALVLIALAAISGYIRADEATKGYYTNRLRVLTAAGVGAAGAVLYQMLS
jgi:hypothetical protein